MRLTHDIKGISKIILVLLLLVSFIAGALFSYVYTMGYYATSEFLIPEKPVFSIQGAEFSNKDTSYFNVTVVNPSYSSSDVNIARIEARTSADNKVHMITSTLPSLQTPFLLQRGHSQTFQAFWNWANYTGITLPYTDPLMEIRIFLQDGRGEIFELKRPLFNLILSELKFNQSISVNHFNVTVQNPGSSGTYVNVTAFVIAGNTVPSDKVTPRLPCTLNQGDVRAFQCYYNWTRFMNQNTTITVRTSQGYLSQASLLLPKPVTLNITQVVFNAAVTPEGFNVTVTNHANSSTYVNIDRVTVTVGEQTRNITQWVADPSKILLTDASVLIVCTGWVWDTLGDQLVKITVYTTQGFIVSRETRIP